VDTLSEDKKLTDSCSSIYRPANLWEEEAFTAKLPGPNLLGSHELDLPNLKKIAIDNAYACEESDCIRTRLALMRLLTFASVDTVTIKHYQDSCTFWHPYASHFDHPDVFSKALDKLHISIATWTGLASSDMDIELNCRHELFNIHLYTAWLQPLQSQLTHLTLHCNTYWGVYPRWQPNNLHFPQLKSLAFGKWTIAFNWQIDFIASLGDTLEQLVFTSCPILHAMRMTPRQSSNSWRERLPGTTRGPPPTDQFFPALRWHTVLPELESRLPRLKHFSMARGARGDHFWGRADLSGDEAFDDRYTQAPCIDESRYAIFDFGNGPAEYVDVTTERGKERLSWGQKESFFETSTWLERAGEETRKKVQFPDCEREDREALDALLATVRGRWA
jgi:hypothetical protein